MKSLAAKNIETWLIKQHWNLLLKGFARVELEHGEKKTVKIEIPINFLTIVKRGLEEIVEAGEFELSVLLWEKGSLVTIRHSLYKLEI